MPSPKISVGFVMHVMQVAGAEVLVTQIIEQLAASVEPTVFCLDALGTLGERLQQAGVPVIVLNRQPGLDRQVAKRLAHEVRQRGIQVLHAHQYTPFFYSALARMLYRAPAKIVFTEHGRHYPDIVSPKRRWANRLLLQRYADITTACCDFSTRALQTIEGFPAAVTVPNGVDLAHLPPRGDAATQRALREKLGLSLTTPYVACIARFHPVKDHPTLIRAWHRVHQVLPEAQLLLVGDGPQRPNLEHQIQTLQPSSAPTPTLSPSPPPLATRHSPLATFDATRHSQLATSFATSIQFLGIRHDISDILRAVDAFTLTSVSEAASLTLLEAMASECPPVLTDVGGNAEHVTDGVEGFLVPRGDDVRLAERLLEILRDPQLAHRLGCAARQRVSTQFNLAAAVNAYAGMYEKLEVRS